VRHWARELIAGETGSKVKSDDLIAEIFNQSGVEIACRRLAKYREVMHIPSSQRRSPEFAKAVRGL